MKLHSLNKAGALVLIVFHLISFSACTIKQRQADSLEKSYLEMLSKQPAEALLQNGITAFENGDFRAAVGFFGAAAVGFEKEKEYFKQCDSLLRAAHACLSLGHTSQTENYFKAAKKISDDLKDPKLLGRVLAFKGNLLHVKGQNKAAKDSFREAISVAEKHGFFKLQAKAYNDLGNLFGKLNQHDNAFKAYRQSAAIASKTGETLRVAIADTNAAMILIAKGDLELKPGEKRFDVTSDGDKYATHANVRGHILYDNALPQDTSSCDPLKALKLFSEAADLLSNSKAGLKHAKISQHRISAHINIGLAYMDLARRDLQSAKKHRASALEELLFAFDLINRFPNERLTSYIHGNLGRLFQEDGQLNSAIQHTEKAVYLATKAGSPESLYRWQWQYGEILFLKNQILPALSAFEEAITTLESIRGEFTNCYGRPRTELRKKADALYLRYVDILLKIVDNFGSTDKQNILKRARETVEKRKVFELREYFDDDCLGSSIVESANVDELIETAVVIYPIVLPDRLEIIATFPSKKKQDYKATKENIPNYIIKHYVTKVDSETVAEKADSLCMGLKSTGSPSRQYLPYLKEFYDWLIRPLKAQLAQTTADTLVFIPDGVLRNIPMSALNDGTSYLTESYCVAITPGLVLTSAKPLSSKEMNVLAVGMSQAINDLPPLPGVARELSAISELFHVNVLMDRKFTLANFEQALKEDNYNVVHIASHGKFSQQVDNSFIQAYNGQLTFNDLTDFVGLYRFRDQPLELLALSACETATGNETAVLGMAGIAVKIGARSALATLWAVNDEAATGLVVEFYHQLGKSGVSRAMALKKAQQKLLYDPQFSHPGYWSPFILINSWL